MYIHFSDIGKTDNLRQSIPLEPTVTIRPIASGPDFEAAQRSLIQASMMALAWTALTLVCAGLELYLRLQAARHGGDNEVADYLFGSWPGLVHVLVAVCLINLSVALWRVATSVMEHLMQSRAVANARKQKIAELVANVPGSDPRSVAKMLRDRGDI